MNYILLFAGILTLSIFPDQDYCSLIGGTLSGLGAGMEIGIQIGKVRCQDKT